MQRSKSTNIIINIFAMLFSVYMLLLPASQVFAGLSQDRWFVGGDDKPPDNTRPDLYQSYTYPFPAPGSTYFNPTVKVCFHSGARDFFGIHPVDVCSTLGGWGECDWVFGAFRGCARVANPNSSDGNTIDPKRQTCWYDRDKHGNPILGKATPRICLYYDPMDGMDTHPFSSPFHRLTPAGNQTADSVGNLLTSTAYSALKYTGGLAMGLSALLALGGGLADLVGFIMKDYNHIVMDGTAVGNMITDSNGMPVGGMGNCVCIPPAPGPPPFCPSIKTFGKNVDIFPVCNLREYPFNVENSSIYDSCAVARDNSGNSIYSTFDQPAVRITVKKTLDICEGNTLPTLPAVSPNPTPRSPSASSTSSDSCPAKSNCRGCNSGCPILNIPINLNSCFQLNNIDPNDQCALKWLYEHTYGFVPECDDPKIIIDANSSFRDVPDDNGKMSTPSYACIKFNYPVHSGKFYQLLYSPVFIDSTKVPPSPDGNPANMKNIQWFEPDPTYDTGADSSSTTSSSSSTSSSTTSSSSSSSTTPKKCSSTGSDAKFTPGVKIRVSGVNKAGVVDIKPDAYTTGPMPGIGGRSNDKDASYYYSTKAYPYFDDILQEQKYYRLASLVSNPSKVCAYEVLDNDNGDTSRFAADCFTRAPMSTPIITACGKASDPRTLPSGKKVTLPAVDCKCAQPPCHIANNNPQMVVALTNGPTDDNGVLKPSAYALLKSYDAGDMHQAILSGVTVSAVVTDDSYTIPQVDTNNQIQLKGKYKDGRYVSGLEYKDGKYVRGGTKMCLTGYEHLTDMRGAAPQQVLAKLKKDTATGQMKASNDPSDRLIPPYDPKKTVLDEKEVYTFGQMISYKGRVIGDSKNIDSNNEGIRDKNPVELGICIDIPKIDCTLTADPHDPKINWQDNLIICGGRPVPKWWPSETSGCKLSPHQCVSTLSPDSSNDGMFFDFLNNNTDRNFWINLWYDNDWSSLFDTSKTCNSDPDEGGWCYKDVLFTNNIGCNNRDYWGWDIMGRANCFAGIRIRYHRANQQLSIASLLSDNFSWNDGKRNGYCNDRQNIWGAANAAPNPWNDK